MTMIYFIDKNVNCEIKKKMYHNILSTKYFILFF